MPEIPKADTILTSAYTPEKSHDGFSLKIQEVSEDEWWDISREHSLKYEVDNGLWVDADPFQVIENAGAAPCVIIYAKSPDGRVLSGHFLNSDRQSYAEKVDTSLTVETILNQKILYKDVDPNVLVTKTSPRPDHDLHEDNEYHEIYEAFLQRLKALGAQFGAGNIEVYLFGQNTKLSLDDPTATTRSLQKQARVMGDILAQGIPQMKVQDHRQRILGKEKHGRDDTIYVPDDNTIYLYRE